MNGWQHANLAHLRQLVHEAVPNIEEGWKWSVPVFLVNGKPLRAVSSFKGHTKYNFFDGAALTDKHGLFNSGLDSKRHRSINLAEGETCSDIQIKDLLEQSAGKLQS